MPEPSTAAAEQDVVSSDAPAVSAPESTENVRPISSSGTEVSQTPRGGTDKADRTDKIGQTNTNRANDEPPSAPDQDVRTLWLRRGDQIIVWLLMIALLGLLTLHWMRLSRWGSVPVELSSPQPREYFYSLEINSASWVEWAQLEGIGEKLARRIVADRDEHGPFRSIDDVGRVRGIGPRLLERIRPFLRVETSGK